jgi:uncharacterized protein involved in exopolysaccharide biosynthesis
MENPVPESLPQSDTQAEPGLAEFVAFVWRARWITFFGALVGLGLSVLYLEMATYRYTATLIVTPAKSEMTQLPGNISGLAAIAGINVPGGGGANDFNLYMLGLQSRQVAAKLAENDDIMHRLFDSQYDPVLGQWRRPSGLLASFSLAAKSALGIPGAEWRPPGPADLQKFLETSVKVVTDRKSNITRISVDHEDPPFAAKLITELHDKTDAVLRRQALARADQSIDYLERQLSRVQLSEHREALAAMLGEQEKARMLASSAAPYAAQPFGTAVVSSKPTSPQPVIVLLVGLIGGAILGVLAMFTWRIGQSVKREMDARSRVEAIDADF